MRSLRAAKRSVVSVTGGASKGGNMGYEPLNSSTRRPHRCLNTGRFDARCPARHHGATTHEHGGGNDDDPTDHHRTGSAGD